MLTNVLKWLFVLLSLILVCMITYGKLFVFRKKKPQFVSDYCATLAGIIGAYSICGLLLVWLFTPTTDKVVMFGFAVSPFLIGLAATYHTEKYYTLVQLLLLFLGAVYVIL